MITYQSEPLSKFIEDGREMFKRHSEESSDRPDVIPLNINFNMYLKLEAANKIIALTARDDGKLVGYTLWILTRHLHYSTSLTATSSLVYVDPEYRKGLTGYKLIKWSIEKIKKRGVQRILIGVKPNKDFGKILERLGATYFEKTYSIVLD